MLDVKKNNSSSHQLKDDDKSLCSQRVTNACKILFIRVQSCDKQQNYSASLDQLSLWQRC